MREESTVDPNETLRLVRQACDHAAQAATEEDEDAEIAALRELRNAFEDLDVWIKRGGFLPAAWTR
jgi:BMFP domain-containing protein YqiC